MTTKYQNFSQSIFYTLIPATTTFDVASALVTDFACTMSESALEGEDWTYTFCLEYTDKPTAASTTLVYRTGAVPFPPGGVIPMYDAGLYDVYIDMPAATHPLSIAPNRTTDQVSATPFVHFTAYEVETGNKTETVQLPSAYVFPYWLKDVQHDVVASGSLPQEFMQQIPQTDCDAGQLQATVDVLIVVDLYYVNLPMWDPFFIHQESSVLGFDDPPVMINNDGSVKGAPITMSDWDLPGDPQPTPPAVISPNNRPSAGPAPSAGPIQTTQADGSNNNNNNNNNDNQQGSNSNEAQKPQPTGLIVGSVGSVPVVIGPSSIVVIGSQTLQPGGPAVIVGGVTPVSLVPSATAIVVGGSTTIQLPLVSIDPAPPVLTIGSSTLTPNAATQFSIAPGQTLTPGGTATIDGTLVSLAPSASFLVVAGSTQLLPNAIAGSGAVATSPPQIFVGATTITALPAQSNPNGPNNNQDNPQNDAGPGPTFVVDGQTLAPGGHAITVSGTTLSLVPGGSSVVVNGVTSAVANLPAQSPQPTIVLGNTVFTPVSGQGNTFIIEDQTLAPGGQAITVSGTVISLAPSASFVVVNGVTSTLENPAAARITGAPVLTIGNGIFKPLPGTGTSYLIGSSTLTPAGVITVAGTTISLAAGATEIVINGRTSFLAPGPQAVVTNAPLLTVGSQTYTATSGTTYVVNGQTLTPGGTIVVDGTTISLAPGATQLVYGSSGHSTTTALFPATTTRSQSISGTVAANARPSGNNGQATATSPPKGSASRSRISYCISSLVLLAFSALLL
jgi:hypothetical protein